MIQNLKKGLGLLAVCLSVSSCSIIDYLGGNTTNKNTANSSKVRTIDSVCSPTLGGKLFTSAWIQRSAEYKALCFQAYNIAKLRLDEELSKNSKGRPLAIITDIDETILDNTPNSVHQALRGEDYTDKSWDRWCDMAKAEALVGALEFFQYANKKGVEVFYISNRNEQNRFGTIVNLKKLNFPNADNEHLLLRSNTSDKTSRRTTIEKFYNVILYIGDNLGDFLHKYDSTDEKERDDAVVSDRDEFGKKFIVLPNPNYGTWEKAMNGGYPSIKEKDKKLKEDLLNTY